MKQFILTFIFITIIGHTYAQNIVFKGKVVDENNKPVSFAVVNFTKLQRITYTDNSGDFQLNIGQKDHQAIDLKLTYVGKKTLDTTILANQLSNFHVLKMLDLSLSLKEVEVSQVRKAQSSNSSIVFNRQAIEQVQAFSLADVLNNLPGKLYSPVDLQSPKNLTLRTTADGNAGLNNAMGTAIIIDGLALSNNSNMQNKNIGTYGLGGSLISDRKNLIGTKAIDYDVTFGGIDLREIPADNIESIEVISGVAPAKYGDLTDGAVIINRQAGKTDYQFNTRINGGSTNFSLTKGFKLSEKAGFLNVNFNYLISNNDPRDNMKKYDRVSGGLMYTKYFDKKIKNTFSIDYSTKLDDAKQDPDDGKDLMTYSKNRRLGFSNRTSFEINHPLLKSISLNVGADFGYQNSYAQWYLNGNVKPMANKDTTGVYEGYYLPGNYTAIDQVVGKPKNFNGNVSFSSDFKTGNLQHFLSYGANISTSSNKGQGVLFDPERPRFINQGFKNERPYDFELLPTLINTGLYLQDAFDFKFLKRVVDLSAGLRYDIQNGYGNLQPRISASYNLSNKLKFNAAYGISTKAPTMAYRYPGPTYFDIPIINYYTGDVRNSLFLVYTHKYVPDNSNLKPSKSNQVELGLSYSEKDFNTSIFAYHKNNTDGFNAQTTVFSLSVPTYTYTVVAGNKPVYTPNGGTTLKTGLSNSVVTNNVTSKTDGIEWFFSTKKIKAIQTSFSFNSNYTYSDFFNSGTTIVGANDADILAGKKAWYGVYTPRENRNNGITSKLNSDTHISKLGLVISLYYDFVWSKNVKVLGDGLYPIAYLDKDGNYFPITNFDPSNVDYGHLARATDVETQKELPFKYGNLSFRLSKELKKKIRFSINAYNVLNLRIKYYDNITQKTYNYVEPLSIGGELSIKF